MKSKIWFVCLSLLTLLSGCYEDKGNYSYKGLAKYVVDENSLSNGNRLLFAQGETLTIEPVITGAQGDTVGELPNLQYTWNLNYKKEIGHEKKLVYVCDELLENAVLVLTVHDTETGLDFSGSVYLDVHEKFGTSGFYVLSEKDGHTSLGLVSGSSMSQSEITTANVDFKSQLGVYYAENGEYLPDHPIRIHEHYWADGYNVSSEYSAMVITPTELVDIAGGTLQKDATGTEMFGDTWPAGLRVSNVMYMGWSDLLEDEQGQIYTRIKSTNELPNSEYFYPVPVKCEGEEEALSDTHIIVSKLSGNFVLLDDRKNKRILYATDQKIDYQGEYTLGRIRAIRALKWPDGFVPLENYEGYNLVHCGYYNVYNDYSGNGGVGKNFLFIFEKDGEYTIQSCLIYQDTYNSSTLTVSGAKVLSVDKDGLHKELLAGIVTEDSYIYTLPYTTQASNAGSYTFVTNGNDLYMYDREANVVKKYLTFDAPVVAMDSEWYNSNYMAVGLANGKFYILEMKNAKNLADDKKIVWEASDNFGRIVSIRYKGAQGWGPGVM